MPSPNVPLTIESAVSAGDARAARLWKVTRQDGFVLRLTDWSEKLTYLAEDYLPMDYGEASARDVAEGVKSSDQEVRGFLSSSAITLDDLRAGRYGDARIDEYCIHPGVPWAGYYYWQRYYVVETAYDDNRYEFRIGDLGFKINESIVGDNYTKDCKNRLGDAFGLDTWGCKQDISLVTVTGTISSVTDDRRIFSTGLTTVRDRTGASIPNVDGWFDFAELTFTSGSNNTLSFDVERSLADGTFTILGLLPFAAQVGDGFSVPAGCNKLQTTCKDKFDQFLNINAFPHVPGSDKIYLTPG